MTVDVSELLNDPDFVQPLTLVRRKAPVDSFGQTQIEESPSPTHGSVQPASGKVISRLPDALRIANVQSFWIREKMITDSQNTRYPDIIIKNGIRFAVQLVFDWSDWRRMVRGHLRCRKAGELMYPNNSSTGGYLLPQNQPSEFGGLSFEDFIQTVFVGVSGLLGSLVRPKWQVNPPPQPDIMVDWLSIGLSEDDADTFIYSGVDGSGNNQTMRMEALAVQCTFYGPNSLAFMRIVRDGLQIGQNREALQKAKMDFVNTSKGIRVPDLVNERWVNRWEMTAYFRREDLRVYPILDFISGSGSVITNNAGSGTRTVPIAITSEEG